MVSERISALDLELRRHVAGNDAETIGPAFAAYFETCDALLASLDPSDPERRDLLSQILVTLEWARSMMAITRARCLTNYTQAARLHAYLQAIPQPGGACQAPLSRP